MEHLDGKRIGDYLLIRFLGKGTFGDVYLARPIDEPEHVAIKIFKTALTPDKMKDFINEVRVIRLTHEYIVKVLDFGITDDNIPYLVMQYAPHGTMLQRHPRGTLLPVNTTISYIKQIASALQYAHDKRLIHRDVKPENILFGDKGKILLSDFGIAVVAHTTHSHKTEEAIGTAIYMAPEQWQGRPVPATDQYALGILIYEWLSGTPPFKGSIEHLMYQHLHTQPPSLLEKIPTIPQLLEYVIMKALEKDPTRRFANIRAFANALEQATQAKVAPNIWPEIPIRPSLPSSTADSSRAAFEARPLLPQLPPDNRAPGTIIFPDVPSTPEPGGKGPIVQPPQQDLSIPNAGGRPVQGNNTNQVATPPGGSLDSGNIRSAPPPRQNPQVGNNQILISSQLPITPEPPDNKKPFNDLSKRSPVTGKTAAIIAGKAGVAPGAVNAGSPPVKSPQTTRPIGAFPKPVAGNGGSVGIGPRPSVQTPLPPPRRSRMQKRSRNGRRLLLVGLIVVFCLIVGGIVYAQMGKVGGLTNPFKVSAQVTITPANKLERDNFVLSALPTGTPNPSQRQVQARLLAATSQPQTAPGNSTGSISATQATGQLTFLNTNNNAVTIAPVNIVGNAGVAVSFGGNVTIPAAPTFSITVQAFAVNAGSGGNIQAFDINKACCTGGITVKNTGAFSGGQDAVINSVVQQGDIDNAAKPLETTLAQSTQASLKQQIHTNERVVDNSLSCTPTVTSDHQLNDRVRTFTVTVTEKCTEEVYDFDGARSMGSTLLLSEASTDAAITTQYALDGQIQTAVLSATIVSTTGQVSVTVEAQGLWVYQFTTQMQQNLKQQLIKLTKTAAQNVLSHDTSVAQAQITLSSGNTLPDNTNDIALTITTLPGAQPISTGTVTQGTPGSGSSGGNGTPTGSPGTRPNGTATPEIGGS